MIDKANWFHLRYSHKFDAFLMGISLVTGLTMGEVHLLNAMETVLHGPKSTAHLAACMFAFVPGSKMLNGWPMILRACFCFSLALQAIVQVTTTIRSRMISWPSR